MVVGCISNQRGNREVQGHCKATTKLTFSNALHLGHAGSKEMQPKQEYSRRVARLGREGRYREKGDRDGQLEGPVYSLPEVTQRI